MKSRLLLRRLRFTRVVPFTSLMALTTVLLSWASACAEGDPKPADAIPDDAQVLPPSPPLEAGSLEAAPAPCLANFCPTAIDIDNRVAFYAIWGSGPSDVWATGSRGAVAHFDGTSWKSGSIGVDNSFYSIWGSSPNDVRFASSNRHIYRTTGWVDPAPTFTAAGWLGNEGAAYGAPQSRVWSIWGVSANDVVAVGTPIERFVYVDELGIEYYISSTSMRVTEGETDAGTPAWRPISCRDETGMGGSVQDCFGIELNAVWGTSLADLIVAGKGGALYRVQGMTAGGDGSEVYWSKIDTGTDATLTGIWGTATDNFLVIGERGTVLRYDGVSVRSIDVGTKSDLRAIWGSSPTDLWIVGEKGTVVSYDGIGWRSQSVGSTNTGDSRELFGVWGTKGGDIWVASDGAVLRHPRKE